MRQTRYLNVFGREKERHRERERDGAGDREIDR